MRYTAGHVGATGGFADVEHQRGDGGGARFYERLGLIADGGGGGTGVCAGAGDTGVAAGGWVTASRRKRRGLRCTGAPGGHRVTAGRRKRRGFQLLNDVLGRASTLHRQVPRNLTSTSYEPRDTPDELKTIEKETL